MYGLVSPTLELMRVKASYVEDFSGAAVLDTIIDPSLEDPYQALAIKWMEVDIPFASTSLVKNRDYVYIDATGFVRMRNGERLAYHLMHSVSSSDAGSSQPNPWQHVGSGLLATDWT